MSRSSSTKLVSRLETPSAPMHSSGSIMNTKASADRSLFYICTNLRKRLEKVPGLQQYLRIAQITATTITEEQACALSSQRRTSASASSTNPTSITSHPSILSMQTTVVDIDGSNDETTKDQTSSDDSKKDPQHRSSYAMSTASTLNNNNDDAFSAAHYNFYTFTSGMLPANVSCDPVTQIWKFFQQGAPLCVIYNAVNPHNPLPIVSADDTNICKRSVYDFFARCKDSLNFRDDELFPISYVFNSSTSDLLKVIQVVNNVLDINPQFALTEQEKQETLQLSQLSHPSSTNNSNNSSAANQQNKDSIARHNVVRELVETERKYVQDLEIMLNYKTELKNADLIPADELEILFPRLSQIVDLQRRLLVGLEANALAPPKLQRIGSIFLHTFGPFKAYEPWTLGQKAATEIIQRQKFNLQKSSSIIRGELELNSFLLKPVQRLCKYPLLLRELVKTTDKTWPHYNELVSALQISKETANRVNEAQRKVENLVQLKELQERVNDWKGYDVNSFGDLLYHSTLGVQDADTEREFNVYLFEQIILFFKESVLKEGVKKSKKKFSLESSISNSNSSSSNGNSNELDGNSNSGFSRLELKGRIYIPNIYNISTGNGTTSANSGHLLTVAWSGSRDSGSFVMRFRTEETRSQWETCLRDLVTRLRDEIQEYKAAAAAQAQAAAQAAAAQHQQYLGRTLSGTNFDTLRYNPYTGQQQQLTPQQQQVHPQHLKYRTASGSVQYMTGVGNTGSPDGGVNGARSPSMAGGRFTSSNGNIVSGYSTVNEEYGAMNGGNPADYLPQHHLHHLSQHPHHPDSLIAPMGGLSMVVDGSELMGNSVPNISPAVSQQQPPVMGFTPTLEDSIKVKLSFKQDIFTLLVPKNSDLPELKSRIEKKLKQCGAIVSLDSIKIRYQDEEGDYIAIESPEDWSLALEVVDDIIDSSGDSVLSIWVIQI